LKQTWWRWKADSKFYNFVFHEKFPIPTFSRSKRAVKRRQKIWTNLRFLGTDFMILGLLFQVYLRAFGAQILQGLEAIFPKKK
jgi:hypothetical protein